MQECLPGFMQSGRVLIDYLVFMPLLQRVFNILYHSSSIVVKFYNLTAHSEGQGQEAMCSFDSPLTPSCISWVEDGH